MHARMNVLITALLRFSLGIFLTAGASASSGYNMPAAVGSTMAADAAMVKMERAVTTATLKAFQRAHPAPLWLFGEDRTLAVRNNIIPAHWFAPGTPQCGLFTGEARPGEFYVFQACIIAGAEPIPPVLPSLTLEHFSSAKVHPITIRPAALKPGEVKPFWIGVQIPENAAPGIYHGTVSVAATPGLKVTLQVAGAPLKDGGVGEAWRLGRLKWLDSTIGDSDTAVTAPFTPVALDKQTRTLRILGRTITLSPFGIPEQYTSFFSGSNTHILDRGRTAFAAPPRLEFIVGGKPLTWTPPDHIEFQTESLVGVAWRTESTTKGSLILTVTGRLEFDGNLQLSMGLSNKGEPVKLDDVRFVVPWQRDAVKFAMGLGMQGGLCPDALDWKWDVAKHQDAVWLGDANLGLMLRFKGSNYERPLINAYYDFKPLRLPESWGGGGIQLEKKDAAVTLRAWAGTHDLTPSTPLAFNLDWYFTPFRPLDPAKHFTDRYYHANQGSGLEDLDALKREGVNVLNIHHNRLCNPYINYPYNDDSIGALTDFVKRAHDTGIRVKIYYTTRELTQNLPEFFALKSLDGEVILPRREGVGWPVTNRLGPHPWLREHVGLDIVPAWKETLRYPQYQGRLDLAVITTPDSRWNNFYLAGLDYLIKKTGIDGLYIDDTALDRKSMQRARRILDADGNTGRRVDMHSWNHFNTLAKWASSSIAFMELYPYYDRLWHGEGFNPNMPPEYWLVEMSGIPYGLMSEMLNGGGNPWRGMLFGMTQRWPWSGDPRALWKIMDCFGIADSEFIGWWDPACPVRTGHPEVKASVYRKQGKTLIALASWAAGGAKVKLDLDWKALGLDPQKTMLWAPAVQGFQNESVFAAAGAIPVAAGKGWLLIADETPRQPTAAPESPDPTRGLKLKAEVKEPFEISVPANTVKTIDHAWAPQATTVLARIDPRRDAGQSWGVGLAVGWANGHYIQINARTDGRWGVRHNGAERLLGSHAQGKPATVAVKLDRNTVQLLAQEDGSEEWEPVAEFPRADFPGDPATVRVGKIGTAWAPRNNRTPGSASPCRVEWVRFY